MCGCGREIEEKINSEGVRVADLDSEISKFGGSKCRVFEGARAFVLVPKKKRGFEI